MDSFVERFTQAESRERMRIRVKGLTNGDLHLMVAIANCAMGRAAAMGPAFLVHLDKTPTQLLAMAVGLGMPSLASLSASELRPALAALTDEQLAWILWVTSAALNEVAPTPAFLLEVAGRSELSLEEWSFDVGLDGILVHDLVFAARLVLGHFPDGLHADGSSSPHTILDFEGMTQ